MNDAENCSKVVSSVMWLRYQCLAAPSKYDFPASNALVSGQGLNCAAVFKEFSYTAAASVSPVSPLNIGIVFVRFGNINGVLFFWLSINLVMINSICCGSVYTQSIRPPPSLSFCYYQKQNCYHIVSSIIINTYITLFHRL